MKAFIKKLPNSVFVLTIVAVFLILWSGFFFFESSGKGVIDSAVTAGNDKVLPENDGKTIITSGTPELLSKPRDSLTGITADAYVLVRTVYMCQYDISSDDTVYKTFASKQLENIKSRSGTVYENPDFPEDLQNAVFTAGTKLGDFTLGSVFIKELALNPEFSDKLVVLDILPEINTKYGLRDSGEGYYTNESGDSKIGDIRVQYKAVLRDSLGELTFVGTQSGTVLAPDSDETGAAVLPGVLTSDEVSEKIFGETRSSASGIMLIGFICLAVAAVKVFLTFKKEKEA